MQVQIYDLTAYPDTARVPVPGFQSPLPFGNEDADSVVAVWGCDRKLGPHPQAG